MLDQLTDRQREVLAAIIDYRDRHGVPPTVRELQEAFGIKSPNGICCHLEALANKGAITWRRGKARSIVVVGDPPRVAAEAVARAILGDYDSLVPSKAGVPVEGAAPIGLYDLIGMIGAALGERQ